MTGVFFSLFLLNVLPLVLQSAHVKRYSVSCMQKYFLIKPGTHHCQCSLGPYGGRVGGIKVQVVKCSSDQGQGHETEDNRARLMT